MLRSSFYSSVMHGLLAARRDMSRHRSSLRVSRSVTSLNVSYGTCRPQDTSMLQCRVEDWLGSPFVTSSASQSISSKA
jgi:hypothetical protein